MMFRSSMSRISNSSCMKDESSQKETLMEDNRVVIHSSPLSLQEIVTYKVICDLWTQQNLTDLADGLDDDDDYRSFSEDEYGNEYDDYDYDRDRWYNHRWYDDEYENEYDCSDEGDHDKEESIKLHEVRNDVLIAIKKLGLPKILCSNMERYLPKTESAIDSWANYVNEMVFFRRRTKNVVYKYANQIAWRHDGTINHLETAKNIVKHCDELSVSRKFKFMSVYCIEDEILTMHPIIVSNIDLNLDEFDSDPLIYYWTNYVRGMLDEMKDTFSCAESRVIMSNEISNIHALEYFWNKLPVADRIRAAEKLIRDGKYQAFVLCKLSEIEQYQLFTLVPDIVVKNFYTEENRLSSVCNEDLAKLTHPNSEYIFSIWVFIKNFIAADHFIEILRILLRKVANFEYNLFYSFIDENLLCRIWDDCPDELKQSALKSSTLQLIDYLTRKLMKQHTTITTAFLSKILTDASIVIKNDFLYSTERRAFWKYVILNDKWHSFNNLFKICGGKENSANEFRRGILDPQEIEERSFNFFKKKQKKELDEFLMMCFSDGRAIADYKIRLLTSDKRIADTAAHFRNWGNDWIKTIDEISSDPVTAYEYKKKLAFSTAALNEMGNLIQRRSLQDIQMFCCNLLNKEDEEKFKSILLQHHLNQPQEELFYNFCDVFWSSFLLWSLGSDEKVQVYKRTLSVDHIFEKMLISTTFLKYDHLLTRCKFRGSCNFNNLDKFLLWYWGTTEKVKLYKRNKIYKFQQIEMITTLLRKKNTSYLLQIMDWFFDGDVNKIEEFQKMFGSRKISAIAKECLQFIASGRNKWQYYR